MGEIEEAWTHAATMQRFQHEASTPAEALRIVDLDPGEFADLLVHIDSEVIEPAEADNRVARDAAFAICGIVTGIAIQQARES